MAVESLFIWLFGLIGLALAGSISFILKQVSETLKELSSEIKELRRDSEVRLTSLEQGLGNLQTAHNIINGKCNEHL